MSEERLKGVDGIGLAVVHEPMVGDPCVRRRYGLRTHMELAPTREVVIVIDSSAIRGDGFLSRATVLRLRTLRRLTGASVIVPAVVRREVADLLAEKIHGGLLDLRKAAQAFNAVSATVQLEIPSAKPLVDSALKAFDQRLRQLDAIDLPLPTTPHAEVLDRVQRRRKPFTTMNDGRDKGYKDLLLWASVLEFLQSRPRGTEVELFLVTANVKDFANEAGGAIHPDLNADLQGLPATLTLLKSIDAMLEQLMGQEAGDSDIIIEVLAETDTKDAIESYINDNGVRGLLAYEQKA